MAKVLILHIWLMLVLSGAESCSMPSSLYVEVPDFIPAGYRVTKVEAADCDTSSMRMFANDASFTVNTDGTVLAVRGVYVPSGGRTFSVLARDGSTPECDMEVYLMPIARQKKQTERGVLKRIKRKWAPPPITILENDIGPYPKHLEEIVSDSAAKYNVYYVLTRPGVTAESQGLFSLDRNTGMLYVHRAIDRELSPEFRLVVNAYDIYTHQKRDDPLDVTITIDDVNDNAPQFSSPLKFTVLEQGIRDVGVVNATDIDKPNTEHTKIRYSLLTGLDLFSIHPHTGVIKAITNTLDRETKDTHMVIVQIKDWDGADKGLFTTGTATISIGDINDNPPTFAKPSFDATVTENEKEKLILRIPVDDKDLKNTPNWRCKFLITKGNENGNFRIDTDPNTNEGLLYVVQPLDYETTKSASLQVMVRNEADLSGTTQPWQTVPVNVSVLNVNEGPEFSAPTVRFLVKENTPNGTLIGTYSAIDPETKSSNGIKYYKVSDPAAWVTFNRNTGELRVANTIDRESPYALNGTYNVTVKAVDANSKTGTGTVIIQVEDMNDNVPVVPTKDLSLCDTPGEPGSVTVVAEDKDQPPFSSPFTFSLPQDSNSKWTVTRLNDTAASLKPTKALPLGIYNVPIDINDLQGFGKTQTVNVWVCQCRSGICLAQDRSAKLGPMGVLALLLPLLLLLLLCLLLVFFCVTKSEKLQLDDGIDSGGMLLKSNTERIGEEVDPGLIAFPSVVQTEKGMGMQHSAWQGIKSTSTLGGRSVNDNGFYKSGVDTQEFVTSYYDNQYSSQLNAGQHFGSTMGTDSRYLGQDSSLHRTWMTNGHLLHQNLVQIDSKENGRYADDILHPYTYEGRGSVAGSIGCCSTYEDNENLDFLNTLGPKFKTLADVCIKR